MNTHITYDTRIPTRPPIVPGTRIAAVHRAVNRDPGATAGEVWRAICGNWPGVTIHDVRMVLSWLHGHDYIAPGESSRRCRVGGQRVTTWYVEDEQ